MASHTAIQFPQHIAQTRASVDVPDRLHQTRGAHPARHGDCPICAEKIEQQDTTMTHIDCLVSFHSACVEPWLQEENVSCPSCRGILEHDDLYEAIESIPNMQLLSEIAPDMDSNVSQWYVVEIEADMEEEDWERIELARKPLTEIAKGFGCDDASLAYWSERGQLRTQLGTDAFKARNDLVAQQEYRKESNAASTIYQNELRTACETFLAADARLDTDMRYWLTSKKYLAHHGLWSHNIEQQIIREVNPNDPQVEARIAQLYDPAVPQSIQEEYEDSLEPLKEMLLSVQTAIRHELLVNVDEARCNYRDSLIAARVKLEAGGWLNNPPDPASLPDCSIKE